MRIEWNGARVAGKVAAAAAAAIDLTMSRCVAGARQEHPYADRTGFLQASTDILEPAVSDGAAVSGRWGSLANYALFVEIGTSRIGASAVARAEGDGGDPDLIAAPEPAEGVRVLQGFTILPPGTMRGQQDWVTLHRPSYGTGNPGLMASRPFLRPQADREYPLLAERVAAAYQED